MVTHNCVTTAAWFLIENRDRRLSYVNVCFSIAYCVPLCNILIFWKRSHECIQSGPVFLGEGQLEFLLEALLLERGLPA